MIVLSTAVRVQARRVELATQAARSYIDGVRSEAIDAPNAIVLLDEIDDDGDFEPQRSKTFSKVNAPKGNALTTTCTSKETGYPYCPNPSKPSTSDVSLYCVDYDGDKGCSSDSPKDMIIQAYRSVASKKQKKQQQVLEEGYLLGVRVYRADAFDGSKDPLKTMGDDGARQRASSATIDRQAPMVEMTTEIIRNGTNYQHFCNRYGGCNQ